MALTDDEKNEIENIIYRILPCSTNRSCQEVMNLKKTVDKIDTRTWVILATIILGTLIQIVLKF